MHNGENDAPSEGASWMVAGLQKAPVPDAELAGVEQTARRLNDVTRDLADTAPALCDPFAFGAALRRQLDGC